MYAAQCEATERRDHGGIEPVGFQFTTPNRFAHWIDYFQLYCLMSAALVTR